MRRYLSPHPRLARPRQHFAAHGRELQTETDVVTEAADGIFFGPSRVLSIDQFRERGEIPESFFFPGDRMLPTLGYVGNRMPIDADGDLKRFGFAPVNDERIGALVCHSVELARLDARHMHTRS